MNWLLLGELALSVWLIVLAGWDWRTGLIPNWGTLPLLGISVVWLSVRLFTQALPLEVLWIVGLGWGACLFAWWFNIFQGGDAKFCLALLTLFPNMQFVWILLGVLFVGSLSVLTIREGWGGLRRVGALLFTVLVGCRFPGREEIEAGRQRPGGSFRAGFVFGIAGVIFLWLF